MQTMTLTIEGMRCEGCAERIQTLLQRQHGVRMADVPFAAGTASVRFNPHVIGPDRLIAVVEEAGFHVAKRT